MDRSVLMRGSRNFRDYVNKVRIKYIMAGKRPPTTRRITEMIAKKLEREDLLKDEFISF